MITGASFDAGSVDEREESAIRRSSSTVLAFHSEGGTVEVIYIVRLRSSTRYCIGVAAVVVADGGILRLWYETGVATNAALVEERRCMRSLWGENDYKHA
jgi:hypothetical protein